MKTRGQIGWVPRLLRGLGVVLLVLLGNWAVASWMLWGRLDALAEDVAGARWPMATGELQVEVFAPAQEDKAPLPYRAGLTRGDGGFSLQVEVPGMELSPLRLGQAGGVLSLSAAEGTRFEAREPDFAELRTAFAEAGKALPKVGVKDRLLASLYLRPLVSGVTWAEGGPSWRISFAGGELWTGGGFGIRSARAAFGGWRGTLSYFGRAVPASFGSAVSMPGSSEGEAQVSKSDSEASLLAGRSSELQAGFFGVDAPAGRTEGGRRVVEVPGAELVAGLAEAVRILAWQVGPEQVEPDGFYESGKGWMRVTNGHRQMRLEGEPYEIGRQHGKLGAEGIRWMAQRTVYGVGLLYSLKQGEWFPKAARELIERQRKFIRPEYFEEMRGVAEGSGLPLDLIQMSNIFPEFFHCSGIALMGEASAGGELLHARVLDYMTEVGLQDVAVVLAVARPGVNQVVTVGYLGFIGSVTGMNEKQVAIGEMGGAGQGNWDGVPMSLLIRHTLETADTLQEAETTMRESPRTCEYYYLISDGKGPEAVGIAATPEKFDTFGPGDWYEMLQKPVKDALLLSGKGRYEKIVKQVKASYGKIDRERLIEIIRRPVSMESNLHNVIFQPQSLKLSVADATRRGVACDQEYRTYTWEELFRKGE